MQAKPRLSGGSTQAQIRTAVGCFNSSSARTQTSVGGLAASSNDGQLRGAGSVIPEDEVSDYPKVTHAKEIYDQTCSGEAIFNIGEQTVPMVTSASKLCAMTFQACGVTKPLASVKPMVGDGSAVVFALEDCEAGALSSTQR